MGEIEWSLFLRTVHEIYDLLEEMYLETSVDRSKAQMLDDQWKQMMVSKINNHLEKLQYLKYTAKKKYGKDWQLPIIMHDTIGNT